MPPISWTGIWHNAYNLVQGRSLGFAEPRCRLYQVVLGFWVMVCIRITTLSIDLFVPLSSVTPSFFVFASVVPFYSLNLLEVHLSHHYLEKWPLLQSTHYFSDFSVKCCSPCVRLIMIPQGLPVALNELIYSAPIGLQVTSSVSFASKGIVHRNEHSVIIYSPSCCSNLYGWRIYIYIFLSGNLF